MVLALLSMLAMAGIRPDDGPSFVGNAAVSVPGPDGRVWVPTDEGLVRVDGDQVFQYGLAEGMPDTAALSVTVDGDGQVWVGTERGLGWVNGDRVVAVPGVPGPIFKFGDGPDGRAVVCVQGVPYAGVLEATADGPVSRELAIPEGLSARAAGVLADGTFVLGTTDGLYEVRDGNLELVAGTEGTKAGPFLHDRDAVFFATGRGVVRWDGREMTRWLEDDYITGLTRMGDALFIGTTRGELFRLDELHGRAQLSLVGRGPPQSLFSLQSTAGLVFGATWGGGLVRFDPRAGSFEVFDAGQGLGNAIVQNLAVDREGSLWITTGSGVQVLTHFAIDRLGAADIGDDTLYGLEAWGDRVVVGTGKGVAVLDQGAWTHWGRADGVSSSAVTDLVVIGPDRMLLAGPGHGEGVTELRQTDGGLVVRAVTGLWGAPDPRWGHNVGALPDGGALVERHSAGELLAVDAAGEVVATDALPNGGFAATLSFDGRSAWVASSHGVYRWDQGLVSIPWDLRDPDVTVLEPAGSGAWVAYERPKGVDWFDNGERTSFGVNEGLPSNRVSWVHPLPDGAWVGTSRGVARIQKGQVQQVLTVADGLPRNDTNDGLVDARGAFWVGTDEGLVRFAPWRDDPERNGLDLVVRASIDGQPLADAEVSWDHRTLLATLDARTHVDREALRFRWRLLPGGDWSPWSRDRTVRSTGLDEGAHTLEVEGRSARGDVAAWSASFRVRPPWWRSPVFFGFTAFGLVGFGVLLAWVRVRRLARDRDRLENMVQDRTRELRHLAGELEQASEAKSRYLADMSHELRTPLNAIIGYTELLAEEARDDGAEHMLDDMDRVEVAARHLLALINDVLDLSKIEAGRLDLHVERTSLHELVAELSIALNPVVQANGNRMVVESADALEIRTDGHRVRQILTNLVGNASKFTEKGEIALVIRPTERGASIEVSDTGIGMSASAMAGLFQPFAQASSQTAAQYGGTGLGLVISKELAVALGGDLTVRSTVGEGSTFRLTLRDLPEA